MGQDPNGRAFTCHREPDSLVRFLANEYTGVHMVGGLQTVR